MILYPNLGRAFCLFLALLTQGDGWSRERLQAILRPPLSAEIAAVRRQWTEAPEGKPGEVVESGELERGGSTYVVRVFKHEVDAATHFTAVFVPKGARARSLPVLVEARGVRFDYPTRRIAKGPFVMGILGDMAREFVIVEPCLRGHSLQAIETVHHAGGDRRDSWDGATRDATAALSVAISNVDAAKPTHVVSFGLSRGGTVALLHAVRDSRVTAVVAMSAPTDWFRLMARPLENWAERILSVTRSYAGPANDRAVQFYEWFLQQRRRSDDEVRRRLIASSPLYFADRLPATLVHHGTHDTAVPSVNAAALNDRFVALRRPRRTHRVVFHEGATHLLRGTKAAEQTRAFLRGIVGSPRRSK